MVPLEVRQLSETPNLEASYRNTASATPGPSSRRDGRRNLFRSATTPLGDESDREESVALSEWGPPTPRPGNDDEADLPTLDELLGARQRLRNEDE